MVGNNQIQIQFLPDGRVKIETGDMSGPLHADADKAVEMLKTMLGGAVIKHKADHGYHHVHSHDHDHSHEHDHDHDHN